MRKIRVPFDPAWIGVGAGGLVLPGGLCGWVMAFPPYSPWVEWLYWGLLFASLASLWIETLFVQETKP